MPLGDEEVVDVHFERLVLLLFDAAAPLLHPELRLLLARRPLAVLRTHYYKNIKPTKTDKKPRWGRPEQEEAVLAAVGRVGGRVQCGLAEVWALFGNSIIF